MKNIEFFCARTRDGQFFYAYLAIKPEKYMKYHAYLAMKKPMDLKEFGDIIECGFTTKPETTMRERLEMLGNRYDMNGCLVPLRRAG